MSIGALVEFADHAIESAASLEKLSQAAGVSVESLSSLGLAFAAAGLSQDDMGLALKKLNVNLSDAAGNAQSKSGEAFRALGVSVTDANGKIRDASVVLNDVSDKFAALADGPNKTAIAVQLFGRAGQNLIPILNQGSAGLDDFKAQAEAAGIVISGPLADAAEQFEKKFAVMKATLSQGFGNQLASQLLPVLSTLAEQLTASTSTGEAFSIVAGVIVGGVKLVAATVLEVIGEFKQFGDSIGALGAIAVAVAHGNFAEASTIWKQSNADNAATAKSTQDQITAIFEAGTDRQLSIISTAEAEKKRIKQDAPSLVGIGEADAAIKELEKFDANIKDQAAAFGLGGAALTNYKLQFGPLADAIAKAGTEGQKLAADIRANAALLQQKQDTKAVTDYTDKLQEQITKYGQGTIAAIEYATHTGELGKELDRLGPAGETARAKIEALALQQVQLQNTDAFFHIDQQLLSLSGHLTQAAAAAFDFNNKLLIKNVAAAGTDQQKAQLDQLRQSELAQAAFNEQVEKGAVIQQQYATVEANVNLMQASGQITALQAQAQLEAARATEIDQLNAVAAAEKNVADSSGIPKLIQQTQAFDNSISQLAAQQNALTNQIRGDLENSLVSPLTDAEMGTKSLKAAFSDMIKSIERDLLTIANKNIAESIFGAGGAGGGAPGFLASLLGSATGTGGGGASPIASTGAAAVGTDTGALADTIPMFASGGTLSAGSWGIAGEKGPELIYSGAKDMQITPGGNFGGKQMSVTNHFTIQAPGGQISRASQMQTAAAAARSLSQANRRNNT